MTMQVGDIIFFTIPELSQKLGLTPNTIRSYIKKGKLGGCKFGGVWVVPYDELQEFINSCEVNGLKFF